MVRRPAAVLVAAAPLGALLYFIVAPALPALPEGDATTIVAGGAGLVAIAATVLALVPARTTVAGPVLIALGAGLIMAALNAAGVGAIANVPEAMLAGAVGLLLALALAAPGVVVAVPLFVAAIDVWSVASGPSSRLLEDAAEASDPLNFDLPAWGDMGSAGHLGVVDAVFLAMFASWAWRYGFRRAATAAGLVIGLLASLVLSVALDEAIPALPLLAAGLLLPNLDRLRHRDTLRGDGPRGTHAG